MARNETHFESAGKGATSVYKFTVAGDPTVYVWFEYGDSKGSLHTTPEAGPYRAGHPLAQAEFADLDELLGKRGTTKQQWERDLMAQFGEQLGWAYP